MNISPDFLERFFATSFVEIKSLHVFGDTIARCFGDEAETRGLGMLYGSGWLGAGGSVRGLLPASETPLLDVTPRGVGKMKPGGFWARSEIRDGCG